jgi:phospholipase C
MSKLPSAIRHIIVLMLENRSFDHMLGKLPGVAGPPAGASNSDPGGPPVDLSFDAKYWSPSLSHPKRPRQMVGDPPHDFKSVNIQLFEKRHPQPGAKVTCGGFVAAARLDRHSRTIAREVMKCFETDKLSTMAALAKEFVVCDHWFSSVPGPTWPNRLFAHAATSFGRVDNGVRFYPGPTIYDRLRLAGHDWAIYYHDMPQSLCFRSLAFRQDRLGRRCVRPVSEFFKEVREATLPSYTFIEPGYFDPGTTLWKRFIEFGEWLGHFVVPIQVSKEKANDQHPPHDVQLGDHLIADVYNAIRANDKVWRHCLFIILHDEHGGLYDHVAPPAATPPPHSSPKFAFDRLGLRVPAIVVSPHVEKGMVDSTRYEHTSIVSTVRQHFCPDAEPLNERDASAASLGGVAFAETARGDAPRRIARPRPVFLIPSTGDPARRGPSEFQMSLVQLAASTGLAVPEEVQESRAAVAPVDDFGVVDLPEMPQARAFSEAEAREFVMRMMRTPTRGMEFQRQ